MKRLNVFLFLSPIMKLLSRVGQIRDASKKQCCSAVAVRLQYTASATTHNPNIECVHSNARNYYALLTHCAPNVHDECSEGGGMPEAAEGLGLRTICSAALSENSKSCRVPSQKANVKASL